MRGRVLIIAGSDPSGGAGLQADIKAVAALGGYAMAAVTALTVQNTTGVFAAHPVEPDIIRQQIRCVLTDIGADAVKIGMIAAPDAVRAIADVLAEFAPDTPIVLDPVLAATRGVALTGEGVAGALLRELVPTAALVTPNTDELAVLTGANAISTPDEAVAAGRQLLARGARAVLATGGHLAGDEIVDMLISSSGARAFRHRRIETTSTHGTGCTLASAVATGLAQGLELELATGRAIDYTAAAIAAAPGFGAGNGPLNHGVSPARGRPG